MSGPSLLGIRRAGFWLALAFAAMLIVDMVITAGLDEVLLAIPAIAWVTAPAVVAAGFVGASSTRLGASAFLVTELVLIGWVVWAIIDYRYIHPSSTGALGLMLLPILQAAAILVVFLVAMLFGWRMRADFLKD